MYINEIMPISIVKKGINDMKKFLSVLIAISMLFAMCIPAFAGDNVDALSDEQQKEIAELALEAIESGNDVETIAGRTQIRSAVVAGIKDFTALQEAYDSDPDSIKPIVAAAVAAVQADSEFSQNAADMLAADITLGLKKVLAPKEETPSEPSTDPEETEELSSNIDSIVSLLDALPNYDLIEQVVVALLGNGVINKTDAKYIADELSKSGKISGAEKASLLSAIESDDASKSVLDNIFEGYTPADLAQLFRGFGDAIGTITSALAGLLRTDDNGGSGDNNGNNGNSNTPSNPSNIPATGDYAIPAVTAVALLAGAAFVLTRKKTSDDE